MLQFLPLVMSMLSANQKDKQGAKQNEISAMLGQAPTADRGPGMVGAGMQGAMGMMGDKAAPGQGSLQQIEHGNTNNLLDDALEDDSKKTDDDLLNM